MKPYETFADFFDRHEMKEVHAQIDLLIKIALTTDCYEFDKFGQRAELFYLRDNLLKCLDAVFILAQKQRQIFFEEAEKKRQFFAQLELARVVKMEEIAGK